MGSFGKMLLIGGPIGIVFMVLIAGLLLLGVFIFLGVIVTMGALLLIISILIEVSTLGKSITGHIFLIVGIMLVAIGFYMG